MHARRRAHRSSALACCPNHGSIAAAHARTHLVPLRALRNGLGLHGGGLRVSEVPASTPRHQARPSSGAGESLQATRTTGAASTGARPPPPPAWLTVERAVRGCVGEGGVDEGLQACRERRAAAPQEHGPSRRTSFLCCGGGGGCGTANVKSEDIVLPAGHMLCECVAAMLHPTS